MLQIIHNQLDDHQEYVKRLFEENLNEFAPIVEHELKLRIDPNALLEHNLQTLHEFAPPHGRFLLAQYETEIIGCAGLRKIGEGIGEVKRMFVKPQYRRLGIGRLLLSAIIHEARLIEYPLLRLDHAPFAKAAQSLYYSLGFYSIEPYPESEIPQQYHDRWFFMEKSLISDLADNPCIDFD